MGLGFGAATTLGVFLTLCFATGGWNSEARCLKGRETPSLQKLESVFEQHDTGLINSLDLAVTSEPRARQRRQPSTPV